MADFFLRPPTLTAAQKNIRSYEGWGKIELKKLKKYYKMSYQKTLPSTIGISEWPSGLRHYAGIQFCVGSKLAMCIRGFIVFSNFTKL